MINRRSHEGPARTNQITTPAGGRDVPASSAVPGCSGARSHRRPHRGSHPVDAPEAGLAPGPGDTVVLSAARGRFHRMRMSRRGPLMVYLAALVALADIPIHLYWALGGTWALPGGAATAGLPGLRATDAVVSVLLAVGAALVLGLTRPWARRLPALVTLTPIWLGSVVCISHGLYGMVTKGLYVAGAHTVVSFPEPLTAAQKNLAAVLDLGVFEPWFLVQGLLLLYAGRWFARTATGRRRWTLSLVVGTVLVVALGIALPVAHQRFGVS